LLLGQGPQWQLGGTTFLGGAMYANFYVKTKLQKYTDRLDFLAVVGDR